MLMGASKIIMVISVSFQVGVESQGMLTAMSTQKALDDEITKL